MAEKMSIMIVDDEMIIRESFLHWFEKYGHKVETAASGFEALEKLESIPADLMFVDIKMPAMDGIEMVDEMACRGILASTPVVVVSTERSRTRIEELKAKGISAYVTKPFTPDEIKDLIDTFLGSSVANT